MENRAPRQGGTKARRCRRSTLLTLAGVEYDILDHALTEAQVEIYDGYADAFQIIHQNLAAALDATNITGPEGTYNRNAKAAGLSAFESAKQRLFNHLLIGTKGATLIKAIEQDLANGHAAVVQIVSTNEAVLDRRLAEVPASERDDLTTTSSSGRSATGRSAWTTPSSSTPTMSPRR